MGTSPLSVGYGPRAGGRGQELHGPEDGEHPFKCVAPGVAVADNSAVGIKPVAAHANNFGCDGDLCGGREYQPVELELHAALAYEVARVAVVNKPAGQVTSPWEYGVTELPQGIGVAGHGLADRGRARREVRLSKGAIEEVACVENDLLRLRMSLDCYKS